MWFIRYIDLKTTVDDFRVMHNSIAGQNVASILSLERTEDKLMFFSEFLFLPWEIDVVSTNLVWNETILSRNEGFPF